VLVISISNKIHAQNNPMGITWVVIIENSNYQSFKKLESPSKDATTIKVALSNYRIDNFIHKTDLTKLEMERFFNNELPQLLKSNQVKSLVIWYSGHGRFINKTGYWIPADSKPDEELSYFNINAFKEVLKSYTSLTHLLVVSNASEVAPGFYNAMRAVDKVPSCDNLSLASYKSSQIFSSAGFETAEDNSKFALDFSNELVSNFNSCLPIESIVKSVTLSVSNSNKQVPKFGKIAGLPDENGTFFFIKK
jgi:hypothetical protein